MSDTLLTKRIFNGIDISKEDLTKPQINFLKFCLDLQFGTVEVRVKDGQPVMSKIIEQWHKHD